MTRLLFEYRGELPKKNMSYDDALGRLEVEVRKYEPPRVVKLESHYLKEFRRGADAFPRPLYFVEFAEDRPHPDRPRVRSSREAVKRVKERWKGVRLEGEVEREFLYWTLPSGGLYPFSYDPDLVVVPALPDAKRGKYRVLDVDELRREGYDGMARWLERAQEIWEERASPRDRKNFPRIVASLDYQQKLSSQDPTKRYYVLYNRTGTSVVSCVIDTQNVRGNAPVDVRGFIAYTDTYYFQTNNPEEAHYLAGFLNAEVVTEIVRSIQTEGAYGPRDIHKRPLEYVPIPRFDPEDDHHTEIARLSECAHNKMWKHEFEYKKTAVAWRRKEAMERCQRELEEINELVRDILRNRGINV